VIFYYIKVVFMIFVEFSSKANVSPQKKPLEGGVFITHARLVTGP
jgi:hypothetical protein